MKRILSLTVLVYLGLAFGHSSAGAAPVVTGLYSFTGGSDGGIPEGSLIQSTDGNFYGTTLSGGTYNFGAVFKITASGTLTTLYSFQGGFANGGDGDSPYAGVVRGLDGNFYGTTAFGGTNSSGSIFRMAPSGSTTQLYQFSFAGTDGNQPYAPLIQGRDASLYGTTYFGGANAFGNVFKITSNGVLSVLYAFTGGSDGAFPDSSLILFNNGTFCGTATQGGTTNAYCGTGGCGTVFIINTNNNHEAVLHAFNGNDGATPNAVLVQGTNGNYYGTTVYGGTNGYGTIFQISSAGAFTNLYSFTFTNGDGAFPETPLVLGSDGNFYGTTIQGGTSTNCDGGCGTIFRIGPTGSGYTNLWSFTNGSDGAIGEDGGYNAALVQGVDGSFYGVTSGGGAYGQGVVFKLTVPLRPQPNQINSIQLTSTNVVVKIPTVAGEDYQLQFNNSLTGIWSNVVGASVTNAIGSSLTFTHVGGASQPRRFYRFDIAP